MIRNFSVENYRSIKDRQTISFEATTLDKDMHELLAVEVRPGCFINKLGLFYGANASGKSNILFALEAVFEIMILNRTKKDEPIHSYLPFALTAGKPTEFKVDFFIGKTEYVYEVSYNRTEILSESLTYYPTGKPALIYRRKYSGPDTQPDIEFGSTLGLSAKTKRSLAEATFNNHSVLGSLGKLSLKEDAGQLTALYNDIVDNIHNVNGDNIYGTLTKTLKAVCNDSRKKEFYIKLLSKADFNITNFFVDEHTSKLYFESGPEGPESPAVLKRRYHISFTNHASDADFEIRQKYQSDGTLRFIELLDALYDMVTGTHTYFFDELGNRMHYDLLLFYLTIFLHNSEDSQLLFSTHSIMLLDEDIIRRDLIYLTEKDRESASTTFTRVSELGLHKNISLFNAYRQGKLGARPETGSPYLNLKKD